MNEMKTAVKKRGVVLRLLLVTVLAAAFVLLLGTGGNNAAGGPVWADDSASLPVVTEKANTLRWARRFGEGYSASPTPPIEAAGKIYTYAGTRVYRLDPATGKILAQSEELKGASGYATIPITYAGGRLYVPVGGARLACLDETTLKVVWQTEPLQDESGAQLITPIRVKDGSVYCGTWVGEETDGRYLCLDAGTGSLKWSLKPSEAGTGDGGSETSGDSAAPRGFYWTGCWIGSSLVVGSDDGVDDYAQTGTEGGSVLYSLDPETGRVEDALTGLQGDIRSSVTASGDGSCLYFTTKAGRLYKVKAPGADGRFDRSQVFETPLTGPSTGSPLALDGKLYVTSGGSSDRQFNPDGGHYLQVFTDEDGKAPEELTDARVRTPGYAQTGLLATRTKAGGVRVWFTYNALPGGLAAVDLSGDGLPGGLLRPFDPPEAQQNYCVSSAAAGSRGWIYYKNDSGYVMAVGEKPQTLKLSASSRTIWVGAGTRITATADPGGKVTWKSASTAIATVSKNGGWVTGKKPGRVYVTAAVNGVSRRCLITVRARQFTLRQSAVTVKRGKKVRLTVKTRAPAGKVTYRSGNRKVCVISSAGVIKGVRKGRTYVYAKANGITRKVRVTVR